MKEFMSAKELFKDCKDNECKKEILISYANYLYTLYNRPLIKSDFTISGRISHMTITRLFGNFTNFLTKSNLPSSRRKQNMSNEEMRKYLKSINNSKSNCWTTNIGYKYPDGRTKIKYNGTNQFLHRISYSLFVGELKPSLVIKHLCNNPSCYNPEHLCQDTHQNNIKDAINDGLFPKKRNKSVIDMSSINDIYDYENLINTIKNNCNIVGDEWVWLGAVSPSGYPIWKFNNKNYYLHKLIVANKNNKKYEETHIARHITLDNKKPNTLNLNPDYLIEGSPADNNYDSKSYNKSYKLSEENINDILLDLNNYDFTIYGQKTKFDKKWAKNLNVSISTISKIRLSNTHKYINRGV